MDRPSTLLRLSPHGPASAQDLTELSLEELMNVEVQVTSAARHAQPLSKTPAAIFVLTAEDIRRSGATSIPELLRFVPGVTVARLDSNRWAVSVRGFAEQFANKLLVLVDGRSVYTPLFSGVWWDALDVPILDVERIEVIRGPGGALWGANAVNGIINVITKTAAETQGTKVTSVVGSEEQIGYVRQGGSFASGNWRVWAKYADRDSLRNAADDGDGGDTWDLAHAGGRVDFAPTERDEWTLSADAYRGAIDNTIEAAEPTAPFVTSGSHRSDLVGGGLRTRWSRRLGERSDFALQAFVEYSDREVDIFTERRTTGDVDFQYRLPLSDAQDFLWGVAARLSYADTTDTPQIAWRDNHRTDTRVSAFAQDEIELQPERWKLTAGAKLEHEDASGVSVQPSLRLLYTPDEHQTWWTSLSRAVRTPSQAEQDVTVLQAYVPGLPNQAIVLQGDPALDAETLDAVELGYRVRPSESVGIDVAAFYNRYQDLILYEPGTPFLSGGDLIVPLVAENRLSADSYGFELSVDWAAREDTRLSASWSNQQIQIDDHGSAAPNAHETEGQQPENQYRLRVQRDLGDRLDTDATLYYVDRLPTGDIDHYWRLDARLEYRPDAQRSFAIGVQNLFHDGEPEFAPGLFSPSSSMQSAFYFRLSWSF